MGTTLVAFLDAAIAKAFFAWALWLLIGELFPIALLVCCWWVGDLRVRTKIILTVLYLGHFGLLFVPNMPYLYLVAKPILIAVLGGATFGWAWLSSRWPPGSSRQ
jgi:hypothetical protein